MTPLSLSRVARTTGRDEIGCPIRPACCHSNHMILCERGFCQSTSTPPTSPAVIGNARKPLLNGMKTWNAAPLTLRYCILVAVLLNIVAIQASLLCSLPSASFFEIGVVACTVSGKSAVANQLIVVSALKQVLLAEGATLNGRLAACPANTKFLFVFAAALGGACICCFAFSAYRAIRDKWPLPTSRTKASRFSFPVPSTARLRITVVDRALHAHLPPVGRFTSACSTQPFGYASLVGAHAGL